MTQTFRKKFHTKPLNKCVLSPELQECMDRNEGRVSTHRMPFTELERPKRTDQAPKLFGCFKLTVALSLSLPQ